MSAFSEILTELESLPPDAGRSVAPCGRYEVFLARLEQFGEPQEIGALNGAAATAYASMQAVAPREAVTAPASPPFPNEPSPRDQAAMRVEMRMASGSSSKLKALRRNLARRWHPDVNPDAPGRALLAEMNARIDMEIEALVRSGTAK